jgi:meiotically up-regulated gene 157 (Mug157) protein
MKPEGRYTSTPYLPTNIAEEPPPPKKIPFVLPPKSVTDFVDEVAQGLSHRPKLAKMFRNCYPNTLETTTSLLDDNSTYIITGDIDLMWLRDSSAQVMQYMNLAHDPSIQQIIEGLIRRQSFFITKSPYGSSFRLTLRPGDDLGNFHVGKARNMYTAMHNYELDSLCYHIDLSYKYESTI